MNSRSFFLLPSIRQKGPVEPFLVTAGNNIVDSYYWKCYVRSGRSIISVSVRAADRRNDRYCTFSDRLTGLSVSMFVLGFNIVMLVVGFIFLGKKFAFTTIVSTFTYPICLELFGQGLGSVIRMGTSTGGMDIPPLILNKYFKIPVSVSLNAFDICILLGQAILIPLEMLLYGVILVITYTTVLNKVLLLGGSKMEVKIISRNPEQIRQAIIGHLTGDLQFCVQRVDIHRKTTRCFSLLCQIVNCISWSVL